MLHRLLSLIAILVLGFTTIQAQTDINASPKSVWGVDKNDDIFHWDVSGWTKVTGALINISVGSDGTVWGVNSANHIWRRDGSAWTKIEGSLKQVSVGSKDNVWGVNKSNHIYRWDGSKWTKVTGSLIHVSVGSDGTVWGVNAANDVWRRDGSGWTKIPGSFKQISVGSKDHVWAVSTNNQVYKLTGEDTWTEVTGQPLNYVSIAGDGTVWGVDADDKIYKWNGGSNWINVDGSLTGISVASSPVGTVTSSTGRIWMDRNLGASQIATSRTDAAAYGDLYQLGRGADGHQLRTSANTSELSPSDQSGHGKFITTTDWPYSWLSTPNNNLWQGGTEDNNPCPTGFRVPTEAEWIAERDSWISDDSAGAFASPLKLPVAGRRMEADGTIIETGVKGIYWTTTLSGINNSYSFNFNSQGSSVVPQTPAVGLSVRCIKD